MNDTEYALSEIKKKYDISTDDGRLGCLNESVNVLAGVRNEIERDIYASKISRELDISRQALDSQISTQRKYLKKAESNSRFEQALNSLLGEDKISSPNPEKRKNVKAVKAEEIILAYLMKHPDYYKKLSGELTGDIFITQFNKRFFEDIVTRIKSGSSVELYTFADSEENEEMSYLSYLVAKGSELADSVQECRECIKTLIEEKEKQNVADVGKLSDSEYLDLFRKKRERKTTEGV